MTPDPSLIYHIFADNGVESEALQAHGEIVRVGIDPRDKNESIPIKADAHKLPLQKKADLALLHPPCARFSDVTFISGNQDDHPNLIPLARKIGKEYAEHYIIENVPKAPLKNPVILDGRMFGLPLAYRRAFECSFPVDTIPCQSRLGRQEASVCRSGDRSKFWWAAAKGYRGDRYTKEAIVRYAVPAAYIHHLMRAYHRATNETDSQKAELF
jgi:hypothetical protein